MLLEPGLLITVGVAVEVRGKIKMTPTRLSLQILHDKFLREIKETRLLAGGIDFQKISVA
jgi:hypothetical protein